MMLSCRKIAENLVYASFYSNFIYIYLNISLQKNLKHLKTFLLTNVSA